MKPEHKWQVTTQTAGALIVVLAGVAFYQALGNLNAIGAALNGLLNVLAPFAWGIVLAYVLDAIARPLNRHLFKKSRSLSVVGAIVIALLVVTLFLGLIIPRVVASVSTLANNMPAYWDTLQGWLTVLEEQYSIDLENLTNLELDYADILSRVSGSLSTLLPRLVSYGSAIGNGLVTLFTAIISAIYMLLDKERLLRQLNKLNRALFPRRAAETVLHICRVANLRYNSFLRGVAVDSSLIGLLTFLIMSLLRLPYAPLIGVIVAITNIVPILGPFLGAVPAVIILLFESPLYALEFAVLILILQQLDGNFIVPHILGGATGLSTLWVLVALNVGGKLLGVVGMVAGVPTFATLYALTAELVNWGLAKRGIDAEGNPLSPAAGEQSAEPQS